MVLSTLVSSSAPGFCAAAWAGVAGAPIAAGAINGLLFDTPMSAAPGAMDTALPATLLPLAGPDLCGPAVASASTGHNLPPGLLNAVAVVESGRLNTLTGAVQPWPWTIDANGAGYMYPTEQAAEQAAAGFEAAGIASLDIGCLQVNLAQHPDAFASLAQAFDPAANADYAAMFLTSLDQKFGNWPQAVAAYHSQTPALGEPYAARVYAQWQGSSAPVALAAAIMPPHGQMILPASLAEAAPAPKPLPETALQMSSLAQPMRMLSRPDGAMTGRGLASYRAAPIAIATRIAP